MDGPSKMDSLSPLTIALVSSFIYGISNVFARLSLEHLHPLAVAGIFTAVNLVVAAPIGFAAVPLSAYRWEALVSFTLMGLFGYAGLRLLFAVGIRLLGVSRHAPVAGIYPLFTALGGYLIFGEQTTLGLWAGTSFIVGGIFWLAYKREDDTWERKHLIFPLLQSVFRTIGAIFRKLGLLYMDTPMFAIAIGGISGCAGLLGYFYFCRSDERLYQYSLNGLLFSVALGLTNLLAQYLYTIALSRSEISLVIPVISTAPLFTILLTRIFLGRLEQVGREAIAGGILIVLGTMLVIFSSHR